MHGGNLRPRSAFPGNHVCRTANGRLRRPRYARKARWCWSLGSCLTLGTCDALDPLGSQWTCGALWPRVAFRAGSFPHAASEGQSEKRHGDVIHDGP